MPGHWRGTPSVGRVDTLYTRRRENKGDQKALQRGWVGGADAHGGVGSAHGELNEHENDPGPQ